jgi:hypothetical protein
VVPVASMPYVVMSSFSVKYAVLPGSLISPSQNSNMVGRWDSHFTFSLPYPFVARLAFPLITMNQLLSLLLFLATTPWRVSAAIGPGAKLDIINLQIASDGFKHSFVRIISHVDPMQQRRRSLEKGQRIF